MPPRDPTPAAPEEEPLADEAELDPSRLLGLEPGPLAVQEAEPEHAQPEQDQPEQDQPEPQQALQELADRMAALLRPEPLPSGEQLLSEGARGERREGEPSGPTPSWWRDPDLTAYGDEDLLPARASALPIAGVEERVSLPDLDGFSLPATLATALHGAVLSGELVDNEHGERGLWLGSHWLGLREAGRTWRLLLGSVELHAPLELSDGPGPRLIIGGDLLAGHLRIDPALRHQLGPHPKPRS